MEIIFFDIDGTLRDEVYGIPESTKVAVRRCGEKGLLVCLCTGRTMGMITEDVKALKPDGIIAGGGSHIVFKGKVLKCTAFSKAGVESALGYLKSLSETIPFSLETENQVYMNRAAGEHITRMNRKKWQVLDREAQEQMMAGEKIKGEDNLSHFDAQRHPVSKLCVWSGEPVKGRLLRLLEKEPVKVVQEVTSGSLNYCELIRKGSDKGHAVRELCGALGIAEEARIAFGDSRNDIDMFGAVGTAVVMKNGDPAVFPYADSMCETAMDNGIYRELRRRKII